MKQRKLIIGGLFLVVSLSRNVVITAEDIVNPATIKQIENAKVLEVDSIEVDLPTFQGYITTLVNVRLAPSTDSKVLGKLSFNDVIEYSEYNENWVRIQYNDTYAYVCRQYVSDNKCNYRSVSIPDHKDFKSFMPYEAIKCWTPKDLQDVAYTGTYGIRMVEGRYCVAVGTACKADVGTYIDLVLENGTIIPAIVSDTKDDKDTQSNNLITKANDCCSEFVVDVESLPYAVKNSNHTGSGNISSCCSEWESPVVEIRVYDISYFN